jgi:hypothetical protein
VPIEEEEEEEFVLADVFYEFSNFVLTAADSLLLRKMSYIG